MSINIEALKSELAAKIATIDGTTDANELLLISASVNNITEDRVVAVATPDDLPVLQTDLTTFPFPSGTIFYVESLSVLVISSKSRWIGFDGRVLRSDAPIVIAHAWGTNTRGELGDGSTTLRNSPVTVVGGITDWTQVSAGGDGSFGHSLAITTNGTAYAWGDGADGRLGTGNTLNQSSPVTVVGGITNWSQLSAGGQHSLGLTATGIAYAWGFNGQGRLGTGNTTAVSLPTLVVGGITNWSKVSAGRSHSLGLTATGIAYAWGNAASGRLGDGTTVSKSSPVTVIGGITNWIQLDAGGSHNLGLTSAGIAYAWGEGFNGRLGDGTTTAKSSPVTVVGGITNWSQVSAGYSHSLGLTSNGIAYAWGHNGNGRLGDGTTISKSSPVTVVGGITNWSQLSAGIGYAGHSLGLTSDGIAYAWGTGSYGLLGNITFANASSPSIVVGGITTWAQLDAGNRHSLAIEVPE